VSQPAEGKIAQTPVRRSSIAQKEDFIHPIRSHSIPHFHLHVSMFTAKANTSGLTACSTDLDPSYLVLVNEDADQASLDADCVG
jgi:hypothetical protein